MTCQEVIRLGGYGRTVLSAVLLYEGFQFFSRMTVKRTTDDKTEVLELFARFRLLLFHLQTRRPQPLNQPQVRFVLKPVLDALSNLFPDFFDQ